MKHWHVVWHGKEISRHKDFYLAQCAVERHLHEYKIDNSYEILPIAYWSRKEYEENVLNPKKQHPRNLKRGHIIPAKEDVAVN